MKALLICVLLIAHRLSLCVYGYQHELIINEILFAPDDTELEFIELLNISSEPHNLCTFSFSDNRDDITEICEGVTLIPPGNFAVIARNGTLLSTFFTGRSFITPPGWPALNNSGDTVRIYKNEKVVDEVAYASTWGKRGYSIERVDPFGPSWGAFNWESSRSQFKATPGKQNSVHNPDHTPPSIRFAEKQGVHQVFIVFDEPVNSELFDVSQFRIQQTQPERIEVLTDTTAHLHFDTSPLGDFLVSRNLEDFSNNRSAIASTPLAYIPDPGDLLINEFMYEPLSDDFDAVPNQTEYVEVINVSDKLLSLRHLVLTGQENEEGIADSLRSPVLYPRVAPQQFALLYAQLSLTELTEAFPSVVFSTSATTLMPISSSSLGMLNTGDVIRLVVLDSTLDEVDYNPSWHYPDLISTRGTALERRSMNASSSAPSNWSSSVHPEGGTPGSPNSIHIEKLTGLSPTLAEITPIPFTPDGDGISDVLSIIVRPDTSPQSVRITIFDSKGRQVRSLVPAALTGSESIYIWDGRGNENIPLPTGMYILLIELHDLLNNSVQKIKKVAVLAHP